LLGALAYALAGQVVLEAGGLVERYIALLEQLAGAVVGKGLVLAARVGLLGDQAEAVAMEAFRIRGSIVDGVVSAFARIRAGRRIPWAAQFGYRKVRYRGLAKNTAQLHTLFALSNLWMARDKLPAIAT
jgi:hypothetical protein